MATFQSIQEIENAIKKGLKEVPQDGDFIDALKTALHQAIYDKVYSFPEGGYRRRYDEGGLGDKRLMVDSARKGGRTRARMETDEEGFLTIDDSSVDSWAESLSTFDLNAGEAITISITDNAPTVSPSRMSLDDMVEQGKGKGNMHVKRPFYAPADDIVSSHSALLSEWAADAIRKYL